jgi:hypothetical protein
LWVSWLPRRQRGGKGRKEKCVSEAMEQCKSSESAKKDEGKTNNRVRLHSRL